MKQTSKQVTVQEACDPSHYKDGPVETIEVLEGIVSSSDRKLAPQQKFCVAQAVRYLLRCGLKGTPEDSTKDLQKAINYAYRAMTGKWIDREFLTGK